MALFDDFFSSSRGPGVVGVFLGVVVLGGFGGLGLVIFNDRSFGESELTPQEELAMQAGRIDDLANQLDGLKEEQNQVREREKLVEQIAGMQRSLELQRGVVSSLEEKTIAAGEAITAEQNKLEAYKADYRQAERASAIGEKFDELVLQDGTVYRKVEIRGFTDTKVDLLHAKGLAGVDWEELPASWRDRFQFDPELAEEEEDEEILDEEIRNKNAARQELIDGIARLRKQRARENDEINELSSEIKRIRTSIETDRREAKRLEDKVNESLRKGQKTNLKTHRDGARIKRQRANSNVGVVQTKERKLGTHRAEIDRIDHDIADLQRQLDQIR